MTTDRRVDDYIRHAAPFARPLLKHLRALWHQAEPDLRKDIKWGAPHYCLGGIVGATAAFKHHVTLGFWRRRLMTDPDRLFSEKSGTQLSALRFRRPEDLPPDETLLRYMREAVALDRADNLREAASARPRRPVKLPEELKSALDRHAAAAKTFYEFSASKQREYCEWIAEAKRPTTRERRLKLAMEWLAEGKPRNWKYMK